jgi:thioredoxin reductase (NADPH)
MGAGGQIANAERIENLPGFPQGIGGHELGPLMFEQAAAAGAEFLLDTAETLEPAGGQYVVRGAAETLRAPAIVVATGSAQRRLGIPGEDRLVGRGVSHCASCDGPLFKDRHVGVIGGGDSALDEALVLSGHAARVTVFCRGESLRAQQALRDRLRATRNIDIALTTAVEEIIGADTVSAVRLRDRKTAMTRVQAIDGIFIYVGLEPNTGFLRGIVALDPAGHIETDIMMRTSRAGVFAAGDIRAHSVAQLAAAAGDGATAAIAALHYLKARG